MLKANYKVIVFAGGALGSIKSCRLCVHEQDSKHSLNQGDIIPDLIIREEILNLTGIPAEAAEDLEPAGSMRGLQGKW